MSSAGEAGVYMKAHAEENRFSNRLTVRIDPDLRVALEKLAIKRRQKTFHQTDLRALLIEGAVMLLRAEQIPIEPVDRKPVASVKRSRKSETMRAQE